jgi:hypothetical protein
MENLSELHDLVKSHPYRVNADEKYLESYISLLGKLSKAFRLATNETKYKDQNMIHDFNGSIRNIGRENYSLEPESVEHVERCIGTIHEFIDTGKVESYWTYSIGWGHYGMPFLKKHIFDEKQNKYFDFAKEEEFDNSIKIIIGERKKRSPEEAIVIKMYNDMIDWRIECKEHWYGKKETTK